jgi:hypothetical protein
LSAILHDIGYAITHVHGVTKNLSIKRDFLGTLHEELCVCRNNDKNFYKKSFICDEHWEIITRLESENKLFSNKHHGYCSFLIINLLIENMFNNYEGWVHHDKNSSIQANKIIFAFNIAAQASLYHTLIKHKYYTNRINSEDKRFPQIDVFSDPISSLLILSDEIQEWGRIGKSQKITQKNGKVLINYCIEDIKKDQILINKKVEGNKTLLDFNLNSEKSSAQDACLNLAETRKSGYKLIEQLKANNYFDIQCNKI